MPPQRNNAFEIHVETARFASYFLLKKTLNKVIFVIEFISHRLYFQYK